MQSFQFSLVVFLALAGSAAAQGTAGRLPVNSIAAYRDSNLALAADGTVWQWGQTSSVPVRVDGLTGVQAIAFAGNRAVALKGDGTVWTWLWLPGGVPEQLAGLAGITAIAGGGSYGSRIVALKADGTVWTWGDTVAAYSSEIAPPAQVNGLAGVTAIAVGPFSYFAVKVDGSVWEWSGGIQAFASSPAQVGGLSGVVSVVFSDGNPYYGFAVKGDGTVWEWQVRDPRPVPVQSGSAPRQMSGLEGVVSLAVNGPGLGLALKRDGTVWAWGGNLYGQLGTGTATSVNEYSDSPPVQVKGLNDVTAIAAGRKHSLAVQSDGAVWAWGADDAGQLGLGAVLQRPYPSQVRGLESVAAVSAGNGVSLVLMRDGTVWQFPAEFGSSAPARVGDVADVQAISAGAGDYDECFAVKRDGTVWRWGSQYRWPGAWESPPAQIEGLDDIATVVPAAQLALKRDGTVWAFWGWISPRKTLQVPGFERIVAIDGLDECGILALRNDGTVWQSGTASCGWYWWNISSLPTPVEGLTGVASIVATRNINAVNTHAALKRDGTVWEWSWSDNTPVLRSGIQDATAIAAGVDHRMALRADGTVWAWGSNDRGQLGDGTATNRSQPVQVAALTAVKAIAAGNGYSLALRQDGTVWAWGRGPLGEDRILVRPAPVPVIPPGGPDLAIAMTHDGPFTVGTQAVYTVTINNIGGSATTGPITVTDWLPPGLAWAGATGSDWSCSAPEQVVTCVNPGPLEPGASSTLALAVDVGPQAAPAVSTLAIVSNESDRNGSNNSAGDPVAVLAMK